MKVFSKSNIKSFKAQENAYREFLSKNYQWVISTLIAIIAILVGVWVVPWGVSLGTYAEVERNRRTLESTATYYFTPAAIENTEGVGENADCWVSGSSSRSDAFRCSKGNRIYDPCFYSWQKSYVDCPNNPGDHTLIIVDNIDKKGTDYGKDITQKPWYIILENGVSCRFINGATDVVAGGRIDYGCVDSKVWLSLPLDNSKDISSIKCYNPNKNRLEICKIRESWY